MSDLNFQPIWKNKEAVLSSKDDFLNGKDYEESSEMQQMIYHAFKKIEELEKRVRDLEELALLRG